MSVLEERLDKNKSLEVRDFSNMPVVVALPAAKPLKSLGYKGYLAC